jgi:mono/diheme cytochrome c family protein
MYLHLLRAATLCLAAAAAGACASTDETVPQPETTMQTAAATRGRALLGRNCVGCHGDDLAGTPVAGWSPNLTPNVNDGLGQWTRGDIEVALRTGTRRDGRSLCATMPRFSETDLSNQQLADLIDGLLALQPKSSPSRAGCTRL